MIAYGVPPGGGGHDYRVALGRRLIVSPGSPNLPVRHNTVARLQITPQTIDVEIVHL